MKRVAVFRGGASARHSLYYKAGSQVLESLARLNFSMRDIAVTPAGMLLNEGREIKIDRSLEGIDLALVLLPPDCERRNSLEAQLRKTNKPTFGMKNIQTTIFNHQAQKPYTTNLPYVQEVTVFRTRNFRDQSEYFFPPLEEISSARMLFTVPESLSPKAKNDMNSMLSNEAYRSNDPALLSGTFIVFGDNIELREVRSDTDSLFSPAFVSAQNAVGIPSPVLLEHIVNLTA